MRCKAFSVVSLLSLILLMFSTAHAQETPEQRDARMQWWREARFGMFIHWGIYSVPAGTYDGKQIGGGGEWIMNIGKIPVATYAKYAEQFNPTQFNADAWAQLAVDAGQKYLVITAKHHDGFCMFHTAVDSYNIVDATPFKRDVIKELSDACAKHGVKFGVYYSQAQDWHHTGGGVYGTRWDPSHDGDYDAYLQTVSIPQVRELLENINPAILWFDTSLPMKPERTEQFRELLKTRPSLIINNRLGNGVPGDTETPEQNIPANGFPGRDWETCMTLNDTWGYKSYDTNFKSTTTLLHNLIDIASKGGNYLLNIGPTAEGIIPQPEVQRLREMGAWLKVNGEAIYGTSAGPLKKAPAWGRITQKPGKLFLHVLNWPTDGQITVPITNKITKAYPLTAPDQSLTITTGEQGSVITLPANPIDPIASVIVAEIEGTPAPLPTPPLAQSTDGSLTLNVVDAEIIGSTARLEGGQEQNIGFWTNPNDSVAWHAKISQPGEFDVSVTYACEPSTPGAEYVISDGKNSVTGTVEATAGFGDYKTASIGKLTIDQAGDVTLTLKPTKMPGYAVMNLRQIVLKK